MKDLECPQNMGLDVDYLEDEKDFGILIEVQRNGIVQWTTIEGQVWDDKPSYLSVDDKVDMDVLNGR